jgi:hypothetical protein
MVGQTKPYTMTKLWTFSALVPTDRSQRLLALADFNEVIHRVVAGSVKFVVAESRSNQPCLGCRRAFFRVHLPKCAYDAFFNAPVGYRAQYAIGTENGERRNRELLEALEPACLEAMSRQHEPDESLLVASLHAADAKLWIQESDIQGLNGVHIEYPPWLEKLKAESVGTMAEQAARAAASAGVLAPIGTVVEIKGGWISPGGEECRDHAKANRSGEIHDYGYS